MLSSHPAELPPHDKFLITETSTQPNSYQQGSSPCSCPGKISALLPADKDCSPPSLTGSTSPPLEVGRGASATDIPRDAQRKGGLWRGRKTLTIGAAPGAASGKMVLPPWGPWGRPQADGSASWGPRSAQDTPVWPSGQV